MELPVPHKEFKASGILAQHVVLKSINIVSGSFSAQGVFATPSAMDVERIHYSPWGVTFEFDESLNELIVYTTIKLKSKPKSGEGSFSIEAVIRALYQLDTTPPPVDLRRLFFGSFAKYNCLMHVWPYWREYVASTSQKMGLPIWTEPTLHFKLKPDKKKESEMTTKKDIVDKNKIKKMPRQNLK